MVDSRLQIVLSSRLLISSKEMSEQYFNEYGNYQTSIRYACTESSIKFLIDFWPATDKVYGIVLVQTGRYGCVLCIVKTRGKYFRFGSLSSPEYYQLVLALTQVSPRLVMPKQGRQREDQTISSNAFPHPQQYLNVCIWLQPCPRGGIRQFAPSPQP